jgi:hypothetical protein
MCRRRPVVVMLVLLALLSLIDRHTSAQSRSRIIYEL